MFLRYALTFALIFLCSFPAFAEIQLKPPMGWVLFCAENPGECGPHTDGMNKVVLNDQAIGALMRINMLVNHSIKPLGDQEHYGVAERWAYPDDGYGDCEDYVLLKRRMMNKIGFSLRALLITIVRDQYGFGHSVLTVVTDQGDFIFDNDHDKILKRTETPYRFIKRQSQHDPNVWIVGPSDLIAALK